MTIDGQLMLTDLCLMPVLLVDLVILQTVQLFLGLKMEMQFGLMGKLILMRSRTNLLVEELFLPCSFQTSEGTTGLTNSPTTTASLSGTTAQVTQLGHLRDSVRVRGRE